jgi:hypothetical protein
MLQRYVNVNNKVKFVCMKCHLNQPDSYSQMSHFWSQLTFTTTVTIRHIRVYMYSTHVQYTCTVHMYNIHVQYTCTVHMYSIHVQYASWRKVTELSSIETAYWHAAWHYLKFELRFNRCVCFSVHTINTKLQYSHSFLYSLVSVSSFLGPNTDIRLLIQVEDVNIFQEISTE